MEHEPFVVATDQTSRSGFVLTDRKYRQPEKRQTLTIPKPKKSRVTDLATLQQEYRNTDLALLKHSIRCDEAAACRMSVEELLVHVHETLAQRVSQIPDVRFMSEADRGQVFKIIFETDLFLNRSGIDPDEQYRHHLECLQILDESETFHYIFCDLEFQGCMKRQLPRLNKKFYGEEKNPKKISDTDYIVLIQKAWNEATSPSERTEVFVTLYQNTFMHGSREAHRSIRAATFMRSVKRFGNIIERTMGSTDPEVFLQAVVDELTDYHIGRVRHRIDAGNEKTAIASFVIRRRLTEVLGGNLPMALCHPDVDAISGGAVIQRVLRALPDPNGREYRSGVKASVEASVRNGIFTRIDFDEVVDAETIAAEIAAPMEQVAKDIAEAIEQAEKPYSGYYPVGAKVHFRNAVPKEKLHSLQKIYGFSDSPFKMLHADTSMLIPPRKSATEIVAILEELKRRGIIDEHTEIQTCVPGRLNNQYAAMLGSSMLLSSFLCVTYDRSSFQTTHEQTASMIMAYDGGVLDRSIADLPEDLTGRIDMLGRKDVRDVFLYQILGSLLSQATYGGPFRDVGREFIQEYIALLERDRMLDVLDAQWVNDENSAEEPDIEGHYLAVKRCTDTWLGDDARYRATGRPEGLSFDVLRLLTKSISEAKIIQVHLGLVEADVPPLLLSTPRQICANPTGTSQELP